MPLSYRCLQYYTRKSPTTVIDTVFPMPSVPICVPYLRCEADLSKDQAPAG